MTDRYGNNDLGLWDAQRLANQNNAQIRYEKLESENASLRQQLAESEKRGSELSARVCPHDDGTGLCLGDGGNVYCKKEKQLSEAQARGGW